VKKAFYSKNLYQISKNAAAFALYHKLKGAELSPEKIESALFELRYVPYLQIREKVSMYMRLTLPIDAAAYVDTLRKLGYYL
jgi:hypothetical protein